MPDLFVESVTAANQGFHPTQSAAVLARLVLLRRIASVRFREQPRMLWAGEAYRYAAIQNLATDE